MKLRLVIDNDSGTEQAWYRLEEWIADKQNPTTLGSLMSDGGRWALVISGYETEVRRVYKRLMTAGEHKTVVEESDSKDLASSPQEAQTMGSDTVINPFKETAK